jgi:2-succinyl-5-enolpyruvyl-6-hydroxy-3-cyclohexene-1-carboxylate synthase
MYTIIKNLQILIALLKEHGISHLVISPGSRMKDFAFSVESDPFFTCYSVVDERSAAYFALGLAQELDRSVGIVCTSSTATCNYLPGITEAFYQGVPLVVMTGDKDPCYLGQMEDQMIQQIGIYDRVVRKSVTLPVVNNDEDFWYCERLINEVLLELNHRGCGPVHINVPIIQHSQALTVNKLPEVNCIKRISLLEDTQLLQNKVLELEKSQKILIIAGQNSAAHAKEIEPYIQIFFEQFNCVIHTEHMANLRLPGTLNCTFVGNMINSKTFDELLPDIIISFGGNIGVYGLKGMLREKKINHWLINENGNVIDAFKNLTTVFECTPAQFFAYFTEQGDAGIKSGKTYYNSWNNIYKQISIPELPYSNVFVIQYFLSLMPENSLLHLSILNSIRISHFFELPLNTHVYANIGTDGIDGCMSTFLGQANISDRLSFLIIGDLSFFYDMSAIRIRHIKNNVRILLINNGGGGEFYIGPRPATLDAHIAAKHNTNAQGWIESVGFTYISAQNKEDYMSCLGQFVKPESDRPIVFEVFTDMKTDADTVQSVYDTNRSSLNKGMLETFKGMVHAAIGHDGYTWLRNMITPLLRKRKSTR